MAKSEILDKSLKILLGVCGSIASYKTYDLMRAWIKQGHSVQVVLSKGATEFVNAQVFHFLGAKKVYHYDADFKYPNNESKGSVLHIDLANWCERFIVAPLSANTLSNFSYARAGDLLSSLFLAMPQNKPIVLYPAMNTKMLTHPFVIENLKLVKKLKTLSQVFIHTSDEGLLACGEKGLGKFPEINAIAESALSFYPRQVGNLTHTLITTGATIAPLDPVRYLTNPASGETGFELAKSALKLGHQVTVIAGIHATEKLDYLSDLPGYQLERVITTEDMKKKVFEYIDSSDIYISSAAISDIQFTVHNKKLKKADLDQDLKIKRAPDILKSVIELKKKHLKIVGFAAETDLNIELLTSKFMAKPVNLLVGTKVNSGLSGNGEMVGFKTPSAAYSLMTKGQLVENMECSKSILCDYIFEILKND